MTDTKKISNKNQKIDFDFAIIGTGCTGLASAMYAGRLGLKTLALGKSADRELSLGGVITLTDSVENYPGFKKLTGEELAKKLHEHAMDYKEFVTIKEEWITDMKQIGGEFSCFKLTSSEGSMYTASAVLFATGTKWRKLPMEGAEEFENKGVAYCALCDGPLYKGKDIGIVGGSDSAAKEAIFLAKHAKKVYIFVREDKLHAEPINLKLVKDNDRIEVLTSINITKIKGSNFVEEVEVDREMNGSKTIKVSGIFGAIGHIPITDLAKKLGVELDEKGQIKINREAETNIKGVYAAGDVVDTNFKQAIVGVSEGVIAAHSAFTFIQENQFVCPVDDPEFA